MKWNDLFGPGNEPTYDDIKEYIGESVHIWTDLISHIETTYKVKPKMAYSKCSAQPGWNIKYQKSGKSLCTLYPMEGFFIALVVVGAKEEMSVEMALETFTPYIKGMYNKTSFSCGGRWLMIEVKSYDVLVDVKSLISIRVKP